MPRSVTCRGLTSSALPDCSNSSSSPSSLAFSTTSGEAPWNMAQGVSSTVASGSERSDHPPAGCQQHRPARREGYVNVRKTRTAKISHSVARDIDSVAIDSCAASCMNCTRLRSRQKTIPVRSKSQNGSVLSRLTCGLVLQLKVLLRQRPMTLVSSQSHALGRD